MTCKRNAIAARFICLLSLAATICICAPITVYAGVGASPENLEMTVAQGSETKGTYTVINDASEPAHVKVDVEDWFKSRLGKAGPPVEKWLTIDPMEFDLGPKESRTVKYSITPPDGQQGELAAMIFFGTPSTDGGFTITSRFGVSIYAAIENNITLECNIKRVGVSRDVIDAKIDTAPLGNKVIFSMVVENTGNVHIRPTGSIGIVGEDGATYSAKIERGFPVYQGKSLNYNIPWNKTDVAPGKYEANISLDYGSLYKMDKKIEKKIFFTVNKDGTVALKK